MVDQKPLTWFLAIAFTISWILFLMPLAFHGMASVQEFLRVSL
jgi:hypothetical protein